MKTNFCYHLHHYDDFKEIQYNVFLQDFTEVFILCKYSFENQNVDLSNLINNPNNMKISGKIKLNFTVDQIMKFKADKIDFYILDKEKLSNIFAKFGIKFKVNSNIVMEDKLAFKILYFKNESRYISFTINQNLTCVNIDPRNRPKTKNSFNLEKNNTINDNNSNNNRNNNSNQMNYMNNNDNQKNNANNNTLIDLNDYKKENLKLKEQINNLQQENHKLNIDLQNAKQMIIDIQQKEFDYINQISDLKIKLINKEKELIDLSKKISKDGKSEKYVNYNDIMVVHFISGDGKINHGIKCLKTDTFAETEEKLYQIYEEFRETNNIFLAGGNVVKRFKKMSENKIKNGDKIQLINSEFS